MSPPTILLTGATGYIGGSVLTALLATELEVLKHASISVLVRGEDKARVYEAKGLKTILFRDFDDSEVIKKAASEHDVVIHTASGFHTGCAKSLIQGLAERKGRTGREVYYIHTSGTSNLATSPLLNLYPSHPHPSPPSTSTPPFSDLHASDHALVLSTLKSLNSTYPYPQRTTDLTVISTGLSTTPTVPTHILMPPVIYGAGTGLYHASTHQIPALIRSAIAEKQAWMIGDGSGIKAHVHITDLAEFYCLLVARLLEGVEVPHGEEGVLFVENGEHSWLDVAQGVAKAGHELGCLPTEEVKSISLQEAMHKLDWGTEVWTESGFAASSRISADFGREKLGWKCRFPPEDFNEHFVGEWKKVLESGEGDGFRIGIEGK